MKSLKTLWQWMAEDFAVLCCTSAARDIKTVVSRTEDEGESFLTITLPAMSKAFDKALDAGVVDSSTFAGFHRQKQGPLPRFLGGFLSQIFDPVSGVLLANPSIDCIFAIRQLTAVFAKILIPCSDERVKGAIDGYVECEKEVEAFSRSISDSDLLDLNRMAVLLFGDQLSYVESLLLDGTSLVPKHGPGATADKLRGNAKFNQSVWTQRLEAWYPYGEHVLPNWRYNNQLDRVTFLEPEHEQPVRVITVPKTLKTPRIIAVEPTCMQYMQQALLEPLVECLEGKLGDPRGFRKNLVMGMIGFTDQSPNRELAQIGSKSGSLSTIDLSEASDRVSMKHVEALLMRHPHLYDGIVSCRSSKASVPGHGVIPLSKFASMGSALCFPIEAMVFLSIVFLGIQDALSTELRRKDIKSFRQRVRVYGDDIIVPTEAVRHVIHRLESFGLKVNYDKTFMNGKFRESCGGDYYDGEWVTPVRCRRYLPQSRADVPEVISLVSFRNQLYYAGLWGTCKKLDEVITLSLGSHFPITDSGSPLLGRMSLSFEPLAEKIHPDLQSPLVKGWQVTSKSPSSKLDDWGALRKCLSPGRLLPFQDDLHLDRQGRPRSVDIKLRWRAPY